MAPQNVPSYPVSMLVMWYGKGELKLLSCWSCNGENILDCLILTNVITRVLVSEKGRQESQSDEIHERLHDFWFSVRSSKVATSASQQVKRWTVWKVNNSSWNHKKEKDTGQATAYKIRETDGWLTTGHLGFPGKDLRVETVRGTSAGVIVNYNWWVAEGSMQRRLSSKLQGNPVIWGPHNIASFTSRSSWRGSHSKDWTKIPSCFQQRKKEPLLKYGRTLRS